MSDMAAMETVDEVEAKTYDSVEVAKYMLSLALSKGYLLNITKVQKLLFIAYGYILANHGYRFIDETPKAWPYGPVFPKTRDREIFSEVVPLDDYSFREIASDPVVSEALAKIISKYAKYSATKLSDWSHMPDSPWDRTTKQEDFRWNQPIPDEYIRKYFSDIKI